MFTTEVGSRVSPKAVIALVIVGIFIAGVAFALAHNVLPYAWITL
jgi:hypothetical protein